MYNRRLIIGFIGIMISITIGASRTIAQGISPAPAAAGIALNVRQALQTNRTVRVIISLKDPVSIQSPSVVRSAAVAQTQTSILSTFRGNDFQLLRQYSHVPALAGIVTASGLAALQSNPLVQSVQLDEPTAAHSIIGPNVIALEADIVHHDYAITGKGVRVAVLDTGIDTTNPDLADSIVAQHCFTDHNCQPGNVSENSNARDLNGHGTNVSGIITSNGVYAPIGFAPDADIVAVRVLDANNNGWVSDWVAGLNWIIANQAALHVKVINISLGTYLLYSGSCDSDQPATVNAISQLVAQGVIIFASTGNAGSNTSIASPACNTGVVGVGATYYGSLGRQPPSGTYGSWFSGNWPTCADTTTSLQTITCFTNSNAYMDIVAPGAPITSTRLGGGTSTYYGTSQASPTAAGVAALLVQAQPDITPAQIETALKTTGTLVMDPKNGLKFPLINALNAVKSVGLHLNYFTTDMPILTWSRVTWAQGYEVQVATDKTFTVSSIVASSSVQANSWQTPALENRVYYWRVRAKINATAWSAWSIVDTFVVDTP